MRDRPVAAATKGGGREWSALVGLWGGFNRDAAAAAAVAEAMATAVAALLRLLLIACGRKIGGEPAAGHGGQFG